jgi:hypothetical protein
MTTAPLPSLAIPDDRDEFLTQGARPGLHESAVTVGERYRTVRLGVGSLAGVLAGLLLIDSMQKGAHFALGGDATSPWEVLKWGNHWAWRAVWSAVATLGASFLAGMIARRHGRRVGAVTAIPSALVWAAVAYFAIGGRLAVGEIPLGYRIAAVVLALVTVPLGSAGGAAGAPFGLANAGHFDGRRRTVLGVRWYHLIWLPFLLNLLVMQATWALMYSSGWVATAWSAGMFGGSILPMLFLMGMFSVTQLLARGAFGTYEALADFTSEDRRPVWRRVLLYGVGYPAAAGVAQTAIAAVHLGLAKLFG